MTVYWVTIKNYTTQKLFNNTETLRIYSVGGKLLKNVNICIEKLEGRTPTVSGGSGCVEIECVIVLITVFHFASSLQKAQITSVI